MLSRNPTSAAGAALLGLLVLALLGWVTFSVARDRKAGMPVDIGEVVRVGISFLLLAVLAFYDAWVH